MNKTFNITFWAPLLCIGLLLLHWANQLLGTYGLMFDETQYWFWGKNLALGYYSKPPMIGWLMHVSTSIFGDGIFGTKMLAPLMHLATSFILYKMSLLLNEDKTTSLWVCVTYLTLPFVIASGAFFSTDTPLMFFWAASLYGVLRGLKNNSSLWWILAGVCAGFGLLSKYTMAAFALCTLLAMLSNAQHRKSLKTPWPWLAAIIAALLFAPNLWWNSQHQFVTMSHTEDNMFSKHIEIYPLDMLSFTASQLGVFGPILMCALFASIVRHKNYSVLKFYIWPLFIIGVMVSLVAGAQAQWIAPTYIAATLLIVPWLYKKAPKILKASFALHILILCLFYAAPTIFAEVGWKNNPMARLFVWNDLAPYARKLQETYPNAVIISDERKIAAALTYELRDKNGNPHFVPKWNPAGLTRDYYDMLTKPCDLLGRDLILVSRGDELEPGFSRISEVKLGKKFTFYFSRNPAFLGYVKR